MNKDEYIGLELVTEQVNIKPLDDNKIVVLTAGVEKDELFAELKEQMDLEEILDRLSDIFDFHQMVSWVNDIVEDYKNSDY